MTLSRSAQDLCSDCTVLYRSALRNANVIKHVPVWGVKRKPFYEGYDDNTDVKHTAPARATATPLFIQCSGHLGVEADPLVGAALTRDAISRTRPVNPAGQRRRTRCICSNPLSECRANR